MNKDHFFKILLILGIFLCISTAGADTYVVKADGMGDFPTIQAAITAAVDGDIIQVADGVYTGEGNRDIDFKGKAITVRSEKGPENCIIDCGGFYENNHRGFYFNNEEGQDSVLEGFTITNAYIKVMCEGGAGIYISGASPTINRCIITNNYAELVSGSLCFCLGGGIYVESLSNPRITNCIISGNSVGDWGWGGGIFCAHSSHVTLHNCLISNNSALGYSGEGGGIYCDSSDILTISNCTIANNFSAQDGGGIFFYVYESPIRTITNSILWGNSPVQIYPADSTNILCSYSDIQGGWTGIGNINVNPLFADPGNNDYHLKSQAGRWDPVSQSWIKDDITSPCIDAGNMASPIGWEPFPNGGIINMGAYGGTIEASKSYFGNPDCEYIIAGDINGDCSVDLNDFAIMAFHWLE